MQQLEHQILSFDGFTLDLTRGCLLGRGGVEIKLRPKSFEVLRYLVENNGRLVGKGELLSSVWPDTAVTDDSLVQCLIEVRRALGGAGQGLVKTIPRRGYIFDADVTGRRLTGREASFSDEVESVQLSFEEQTVEGERTTRSILPSAPVARRLLRSSWAWTIILACGAIVIAAIVLTVLNRRIEQRESQTAPIHSIAVLPLENLSGDPAQDYFADGMTEALISSLTQIHALNRVISRTSMMRYKTSNKSLPEIARELNVDAVIEGSVQRSGERVRVTAKLIPAATDSPVWTREYERDLSDMLKLQSEIARAVADEVRIKITPEERARLASARTVNPQAHEAYLLGRFHFLKNNEQGWERALDYFERAIELAPDYAAAYAGLSDVWLQRTGFGGVDFKKAALPARSAALKAISLDEQLAEPHISLARIKFLYDWDWAGAEQEFRRALEIDPGSLDAHSGYGHLLMFVGRHDEAVREGEIAVQIDPLSSGTHASLGWFYYRARSHEEAISHLKRAFELEPRSVVANSRLGIVYTHLSRYDEAIDTFERIRQLAPQAEGFIRTAIARVNALRGKKREAREMIRGVKASAFDLVGVYAALGEKDVAFRILDKAVGEHQNLAALKVDPSLEVLHSDPRWQQLLRRMNFSSE